MTRIKKDADKLKIAELKKELAEKETELKIESSLEKVRLITLSMKERDDMVKICRTIASQLKLLGVKEIRNVQTAIFYKDSGTYMNYEFYAKHNKTFITDVKYRDHEIHLRFAAKMLKGRGESHERHLEGKELKKWLAFQKTTNVFIDKYLITASSLDYYWYSLGPVALGISTYFPLTKNEKGLFLRFLNVFELSYRRYLDIENAEAQTREALIQTSLEKVRAVAMGMGKSADLLDVCETLFEEFRALGFHEMRNAMINIHNDEKKTFINYDYSDTIGKSTNHLTYNIHRLVEKQIKKTRSANEAFSETYYAGKDLEEWKRFRKEIGEKDDPRLDNIKGLYYYFFSIGAGSIGISTFGGIKEEKINLLKRFRNVFALSYQRYVDIENAETRAREARIEASLERMRAVAMAMHKSDDLLNICETMYKEILQLGFTEIRNAIINIYDDAEEAFFNYDYTEEVGKQVSLIGYESLPFVRKIIKTSRSANDAFSETHLEGKDLDDLRTLRKKSGQGEDSRLNNAKGLFYYLYSIGVGSIGISTFEKISEEKILLLKRFINVFFLCYQRYTDIAKAEAQAHESQIQLALERVRARTMAMQKSGEILEATTVVFRQFRELGSNAAQVSIVIFDEEIRNGEIYFTTDGERIGRFVVLELEKDVYTIAKMKEAFKRGEKSNAIVVEGKELQKYNRWRNEYVGEKRWDESESALKKAWHVFAFFFSRGMIVVSSETPIPRETRNLLGRFAFVFDQTFTRFLDLQKAEAQAREGQIELSLERVRAKTMAMHHSEEIQEILANMLNEMRLLDMAFQSSLIWIVNDQERYITTYQQIPGIENSVKGYRMDYNEQKMFKSIMEAWYRKEPIYVYELEGEDKSEWLDFVLTKTEMKNVPESAKQRMRATEKAYESCACNDFGILIAVSFEPLSEANKNIAQRFSNVFQQSYTRFIDIKNAEAQAREARIEAALERVRSRSMGMQKSAELKEVIEIVFEQFAHLDIRTDHAGFVVDYKPGGDWNFWIADSVGAPSKISVPYFDSQWARCFNLAKEKGTDLFATRLDFEEKNKFYRDLLQYIPGLPEEARQFYMTCPGLGASTVVMENVSLYIENFKGTPYTEEENTVLRRFGKVFHQTYTRFLDLQRAEAQAWEAQIEAGLERVRSKAMAIRESAGFSTPVTLVFSELGKLGIRPRECGVGLVNKDSGICLLYTVHISPDGDSFKQVGSAPLSGIPGLKKIYESWLNHKEYYPESDSEKLVDFYTHFSAGFTPEVNHFDGDESQYGHFLPVSNGFLYAWSDYPYPVDEIKIIRRFSTIIDLIFRRYLELQHAEVSAKEAIKQASLDRIRAEIASMRTIGDLDRITPLIWNELKVLGIPFLRCGVFIMDDKERQIHTFLSTPEGKAFAAFHLPYDTPGGFSEMINDWHNMKIYLSHWAKNEFSGLAERVISQGAVRTSAQYLANLPEEGLYLHFLPFVQGMLYVGNVARLNKEEMELVQAVSNAFSTAYARYEDFTRLEAAKKQVDSTLSELRATQKQLIQSEKMASLGELTAGIAHEIQNPLNFVNNFSEVSNELIGEMNQELDKGDIEGAKLIANDIRQNLEKINHHGKRADGIVKGMLQHSRTSSGQKELTDINALVDEYVRLAYHGYRAKEKSFNARFETDLDHHAGKMNIVPQDMGRVLLNLINNAFFAVNEKKKTAPPAYEPAIKISTKQQGDHLLISVSDNGNGIPQNIIDKIFQPFFTTKETGQGTGLGLSLSYDIVKAHGGEIKVETIKNEGTRFVVELPAQ